MNYWQSKNQSSLCVVLSQPVSPLRVLEVLASTGPGVSQGTSPPSVSFSMIMPRTSTLR